MKPENLVAWFNSMPVDDAETIKLEFAVAIDNAIKNKKMSRKDVAASINTSPAWITKVLRGDVNLTIDSMVKLCNAVGHELQIKIALKYSNKTVVSHEEFISRRYAKPKYMGAYEIDLSAIREETVYCNDKEYAHAA